ncbi:MAG TPA: hypothetical protein PKE04_03795, partial [Clostridia bacterium]|nr:hypothetical protein [Clostridia bacterium]
MRKMFHALRERWQSSSLRERAALLSMTVLLCMVLVSIATNVYINTINRKASQRNIDNRFETVQRFVNKHLTSITDALHVVSNDPNTYILAALREMHSVGREKQYVDKLQTIQSAILHANRDFTSLDLILVRGDTVVSDAYVCDIDYYIRRNQIADLHLSLQQAYRQSSNLAISPAYYSDSMSTMNFIQHLYMPNSYFAVVLNISRNAIEIRLADVMSDAETSVYLLTPLGELYGLYDGAGLKLSAEDALNVYAHPDASVELAGETLQARRAKIGSLRLLALYPQTEMASALRHSALFLLVITGVFVAFAFLLYLEARNSFVNSAQALLSKYETSPGKDKQRNEYNRMDSIFQNMLLNIKSMEQRVKDAEE